MDFQKLAVNKTTNFDQSPVEMPKKKSRKIGAATTIEQKSPKEQKKPDMVIYKIGDAVIGEQKKEKPTNENVA